MSPRRTYSAPATVSRTSLAFQPQLFRPVAAGLVRTSALQLQRERGNRALLRITAGPSGIVQRQGGAHGAGPREQREFVRDTAHFFSTSADFYRDEHVSITPQLFDRLINTWYSMIIDRER